MTHSGGKPHTNVGDRGQRYEIRYDDSDGKEHVFGWQNSPKGGLLDACRPEWHRHNGRIIDRQNNN